MHSLRTTLLASLLLAAATATAGAADTKSLGDFGAWRAYSYTEKDGKVCYATAAADSTTGGAKGRRPTYLAVTNRPKSHNEVSLIGAYDFKPDSDAEIQVGAQKYAFFTKGDSAWTKQVGADKSVIAAMVKGRDVVVHATPAKGKPVTDTIPLNGFTKALAAIDKACGGKR
ncbi:MAG: invasion associated locus B family protein [Magnetospirillum sp.]|nr:invasion associated locus B family protein [Magnetospirillum sp.]